ncbi:MAG TPA: D-2-hydroxyacid dehydrogenase [Paenibacillaceae bacterium]
MEDGKLKIAILYRVHPNPYEIEERHVERIRQTAPGAEIIRARDEGELLSKTDDADVLLTWGGYQPVAFCGKARSLKWIHAISAGVDGLLSSDIAKMDVTITRTKDIHGIPIANHVLGFMLMFVRQFPLMFRQQQNKVWKKTADADELWGKTVGIIGLGSIGGEIARQCKLLGMRVLATKRTPAQSPWVDELYPPEQTGEVFRQADFVVVALPLTPATTRIIGEKELRLMKKTAYFINIARGGVVDEDALIRVLREGAIAGAGLDVFEEEPLPPDSPLWEMPNVIITPHTAADSPLYMDRMIEVFCENLKRFIRGEKLLHEVDKNLRY